MRYYNKKNLLMIFKHINIVLVSKLVVIRLYTTMGEFPKMRYLDSNIMWLWFTVIMVKTLLHRYQQSNPEDSDSVTKATYAGSPSPVAIWCIKTGMSVWIVPPLSRVLFCILKLWIMKPLHESNGFTSFDLFPLQLWLYHFQILFVLWIKVAV